MKQTNNAIKFLMAQYRAIFRNANLKMFLAAATAAAALAAGQAQAAAPNGILDIDDFTKENNATTNAEVVTSGSTLDMTKFTKDPSSSKFDDNAFTYATASGATTLSGTAAQVNIKGDAHKHIAFAGLTLKDGASINLVNDEKTNTKIVGYKSGTAATGCNEGTLTVNASSITGEKTFFMFNKVNVENGSVITLGGKSDVDLQGTKDADWYEYSSFVSLKDSASTSGAASYSGSVVNLNHESRLSSDGTLDINATTINFNGQKHADGYSTAFLDGAPEVNDKGTVTVKGNSVLNAVGDGAIYADTIKLEAASLSVAKDKQFVLDGAFTSKEASSKNKHNQATITIGEFTADGEGTLIIGDNSAAASTVGISGNAIINTKIVNNAAISVNKSGSLTLDAGMIAADKGVFAGKSGSLAITEATLNLNGLSGDKTLDLADAKQIAFAENAAHNKVAVKTSATIKGGNIAISDKITGLATGTKLSVDAENLTLGSAKFDSSTNELGIGAGTLAAENVTFINKDAAKPFVLKNDLELATQGMGTIKGSLQVGDDKSSGSLSIHGGDYKFEGGKLAVTKDKGSIALENSSLDASSATAYDLQAKTVSLSGQSTLVLDGSKVLTVGEKGVEYKKGVDATAFAGEKSSTIKLTNGPTMTKEQFTAFRDANTSFTGMYDGLNVQITDVSGSMTIDKIEYGIKGPYDNTQATVTTGNNSLAGKGPIAVGSLALDKGVTDVSIADSGSLTLTNAGANGNANSNFVQTSDGKVAGITIGGTTGDATLALQGNGNIGEIKGVKAGSGDLYIGSVDGSVAGNVNVAGNIGAGNALGTVTVGTNSALTVAGDVATNELDLGLNSSLDLGTHSLTIGTARQTSSTEILGDVTANTLTILGSGGVVIAGDADITLTTLKGDSGSTVQVGDDSVGGLGATILTTNLDLNGGSIFVDPDWGKPASKVITDKLTSAVGSATVGAGTLNGNAYIGKNAAMGIGFTSEAELDAVISDYLTVNGGFDKNGVQNALVLNDSITIDSGKGIVVDATLTSATYPSVTLNNDVKLGANSALVITDEAFGADKKAAAVTFTTSGTVTADATSKVSLVGDITAADKGLKVFDKATTGTINVEAAGGLLVGQIGADGTIATLALDPVAEKAIRSEVSAPIGQLFVDFADGKFAGSTGTGYEFLKDQISLKGFKAVDAAAHAATYAGAQQAAVASVTTMAEAVGGRVGSMGVEAANIAATGSQANGGVWVSPMYKSVDADVFAAEGVSYGADVDLAGVAFGADTVNGNMRFGAVFNIGSGDADGKGQGNGLKDEFDYYGIGIYSAMGFGNFAVVGDASLNVISHDVEGLGLKGEADTTAVTMGLTGQYTISNPMVDVTPHLGARFIRLDTDSYDLSSEAGVIATTDFDVQNVFSVPLGVTLSKAFEMGGWSLAPSADLSITFNAGDTDVKSTTNFEGVAKNIGLTTEVLDEVTYGVAVGLGAQYGAFGTNFGINYTGSENTDSFGVNAQARYMF